MAIPMQKALLGDDGVFFGAMSVAIFNILCWTYGLWLMNDGGDRKDGVRENKKAVLLRRLKTMLNPGTLGCAVGLALFLARVELPGMLVEPMRHMADLNTPIPMVVIGYYLAEAKLTALFDRSVRRNFFGVAFIRLFAAPLVLLGVLLATGIGRGSPVILMSCMVAAAAPVAAATTMFASKFNRDTTLSVELVSFTTILSIVSMPLVLGLARHLLSGGGAP